MGNKYIGVTIGPIFDTINLTSSPAALWAASYIFSSLTKTICHILTTDYKDRVTIVSPYYDEKNVLLKKNDGVGLFHDRIIFRVNDDFPLENMETIRKTAIEAVRAEFFGRDKSTAVLDFLNEYIMISYAEFEANNPIIGSAQMLDCMELSKPFVFCGKRNPFNDLFTNHQETKQEEDPAQEGKNAAVKKLVAGFGTQFQLYKGKYKKKTDDGNGEWITVLKSISDICNTESGLKRDKYYAILRSDGDNIGKLIASLADDEQVCAFSEACLTYCSEVSELVRQYGGATIYSGGDDLLAILPLTCQPTSTPQEGPKNLFEFVQSMNKIFAKHFKEPDAKGVKPTFRSGPAYQKNGSLASLSFGITVAYYRFPLYESLSESASLLFDQAKKVKNCTVIKLQKHAGQSAGLRISHDKLADWCDLTQTVQQGAENAKGKDKIEARDRILLSAMHKLSLFERLFDHVTDPEEIKLLFKNIFDAEAHEDNDFVHKTLPEWFAGLQSDKGMEDKKICALGNDGVELDRAVPAMQSILCIQKFMIEKGGEKG